MRGYFSGKMSALTERMTRKDTKAVGELEELLIASDFGPVLARRLVEETKKLVKGNVSSDAEAVRRHLSDLLEGSLIGPRGDAEEDKVRPRIILLVGPHGVGKTTSAGKLAFRMASRGYSVVLAAADTHRAAAIEQLQQWSMCRPPAGRVDCIAQETGSDPAAVAFDAVSHARQVHADMVIVDTAGRIHTQQPLMESLQKVKRALMKACPTSPCETLLVLDATVGQNSLSVARTFSEAVPLDGLILTKTDGTAKGGIVFALSAELRIPVRFLGIGEKPEDLVPFERREFVEALLDMGNP